MNENRETEKDLLEIIKERIANEGKFKDKAKACRKSGISPTTYDKAITKAKEGKKFDDLTDGEREVLLAHIAILNERAEELNEQVKAIC